MKQYRYAWTKAPAGSPKAQEVGEWLQGLTRRTTDDILTAAEDTAAPIHNVIEWNESRAALRYRQVQIRQIMARLVVNVQRGGRPQQLAAFMLTHRKTGYVPSLEANPEELAEFLEQCVRRMQSFKRRFAGLAAVRDVVKEMDRAEARAQRLLKAKRTARMKQAARG